MGEIDEDLGFDEGESLEEADVVEVELDRGPTRCVVLAVLEDEGQEYAVLQVANDDEDADAELFVARYDGEASGTDRFLALQDEAELARVQAAVAQFLPVE